MLSSELGRRLGLKVGFKELRLKPKFLNRGLWSCKQTPSLKIKINVNKCLEKGGAKRPYFSVYFKISIRDESQTKNTGTHVYIPWFNIMLDTSLL